ncbi:hypothetical protein [Hafnia phage yong3]|nr:hypothetical protein [Hafnia phage yong3]
MKTTISPLWRYKLYDTKEEAIEAATVRNKKYRHHYCVCMTRGWYIVQPLYGAKFKPIWSTIKLKPFKLRNPRNLKVTEEDAELIVQLYESGLTYKEIAEKFELCPATIGKTYHKYKLKYTSLRV